MKILIIQNEDKTPPGSIITWINQHRFDYEIHFFSKGNLKESIDKFDLFFICGGGMNVDQVQEFPWLLNEKRLIKKLIINQKKIIGICLGAQLIAESLGGKVFKAPEWEIGWQTIKLLNSKEDLKVFQWHGQQFETPTGAFKIAENSCCPHQAFNYENNIMAFQFHPEAMPEWIIKCSNDPELPSKSHYIQTSEEIKSDLVYQEKMMNWFFGMLNSFL